MNLKLKSPNQEPEPVKEDKIILINPSMTEFKTSYFDDKNNPVEVIIPPVGTKELDRGIGETVLDHLVDFVINQSGFAYKSDVNIEKAEIRKRCVLYE